MEWLGVVEAAFLFLVIMLVLPVVWLYARRRWLDRQGGMLQCGLRGGSLGERWRLGAARYNGEELQWFRAFSLSFQPRLRFRRTATAVRDSRMTTPEETAELYGDLQVVEVDSAPDFGEGQRWELAMHSESATGLLSWLEAAPPSVGRFRQ